MMQGMFSTFVGWMVGFSISHWFLLHDHKVGELMHLRDIFSKICNNSDKNLKSCLENISRQVWMNFSSTNETGPTCLAPTIHWAPNLTLLTNTSLMHNTKSVTYPRRHFYLDFHSSLKYQKLLKEQGNTKKAMAKLEHNITLYQRQTREMQLYIEVLQQSLEQVLSNLSRHTLTIERLQEMGGITEMKTRSVMDNIKEKDIQLQNSLKRQEISARWLGKIQRAIHATQSKMDELYTDLFDLQQRGVDGMHVKTVYPGIWMILVVVSMALGEFLLCACMCRLFSRWSSLEAADVKYSNANGSPAGFWSRQRQRTPEEILEDIRQRQLEDFICQVYFHKDYNKIYKNLSESIQKDVMGLQLKSFQLQRLNDIPRMPSAKLFLIFIDAHKNSEFRNNSVSLELTAVKAVQKMGADVFVVFTQDEHSQHLEKMSLYNTELGLIQMYLELSRLSKKQRVLSVYTKFFPHQILHITDAVKLWHE